MLRFKLTNILNLKWIYFRFAFVQTQFANDTLFYQLNCVYRNNTIAFMDHITKPWIKMSKLLNFLFERGGGRGFRGKINANIVRRNTTTVANFEIISQIMLQHAMPYHLYLQTFPIIRNTIVNSLPLSPTRTPDSNSVWCFFCIARKASSYARRQQNPVIFSSDFKWHTIWGTSVWSLNADEFYYLITRHI